MVHLPTHLWVVVTLYIRGSELKLECAVDYMVANNDAKAVMRAVTRDVRALLYRAIEPTVDSRISHNACILINSKLL